MKKTLIKVLKWAGILIAAGGAMAVINDFKASSIKRTVSEHLQDAGLKSPSTSQGYTPQPEQPKQQEYDDFEYYGDWWTWSNHEAGNSFYIAGTTTPEKRVLMLSCGTSDMSCDYIITLFSGCDSKYEKVNLEMGEQRIVVAAECDEESSGRAASYSVNIRDFLDMSDAESADTLTFTVKGGTSKGDVANFSLFGAREALNNMKGEMGALSSMPKDIQGALLSIDERNKNNDDLMRAINSIPELKYWYENDTPELHRAVEIDDRIKDSRFYEGMPLRTRLLIVVEAVKKEK